jgi:hypothetical protein
VARTLIAVGTVLIVAGLFWPWLTRLGLGRLPGDIFIQRDGWHIYLPMTSSILVSALLSFLLWLFRR